MIVADSSALVALLNRKDAMHDQVAAHIGADLIVPASVLPEVDYLATKYLGEHVARAFLQRLAAGEGVFCPVTLDDLNRVVELCKQFADLPLGYVDASVVAIAERLRVRRVLTLDRRHFGLIRPRGLPFLELLP